MALNDYKDLSHSGLGKDSSFSEGITDSGRNQVNRSIDEVNDSEANSMTTPAEKAQLRTEVERISVTERMADFWQDYEAGQNPGVIRPSDYTLS